MDVKEEEVHETPEALKREAEVWVDPFMRKNMPHFRIGEVIRQEQEAREEERKRREMREAELREAYAEALRILGDPDARAPARSRAVLVVGRAGKREPVPLLLRQLERREFEGLVVQNTMRALGRLKDPRAVPHLLK